jgi:hypothetical protein
MATGRDDKARARTGYSRASSWTTGRRTGPACRRRTAGPRLDRAPGWRDGRAARRPRSGLPLLLPLREQQTEATPWTQAKHVPASEQNTHVAAPTRAQARRTVRTPIHASRRASPDILSRYSRDLHVFWLLCIDIAFFFQVGGRGGLCSLLGCVWVCGLLLSAHRACRRHHGVHLVARQHCQAGVGEDAQGASWWCTCVARARSRRRLTTPGAWWDSLPELWG